MPGAPTPFLPTYPSYYIEGEAGLFEVAGTNPLHTSALGFCKLLQEFMFPKSMALITPFHSLYALTSCFHTAFQRLIGRGGGLESFLSYNFK